ncbi:MAG: hypothetical protein LBL56_07335 [Treponema sp.]|jgi:hypothetical protein|nr:hypothetical protein [Treponema sp.]
MICPLRPRRGFLGGILFFAALGAGFGQEPSLEDLLPGLRERAVILEIISRVVDRNQQVVWNSVDSKVTLPGKPVRINMVGTNVLIALQFTFFFRPGFNSVLVAQGQIWVDVPDEGIRYQTTLQTIPIEIGEPIFFFPLGSPDSPEETRIELELEIRPYGEMEQDASPWDRGRRDPGRILPGAGDSGNGTGESE